MMDQLGSKASGVADVIDPTKVASDGWDAFIHAEQADAFCRAWLDLLCGRIAGTQAAAVLVADEAAGTFVPIAVWPDAISDLARLTSVIEAALQEGRGAVLPVGDNAKMGRHLAYPVFVDKKAHAVVALEVACGNDRVPAILRELHWGAAWLVNILANRERDQAVEASKRIGSVMETVAVALRHGKFRQALFEVANELRRRFDCSRVAIGLTKHASIRLVAISEAATFEKSTPLSKAYVQAMEEVYDQGRLVAVDGEPIADDPSASLSVLGHRKLQSISGASHVISMPMMLNAQCVGVITLERTEAGAFDEAARAWLDTFCTLAAPIVEQRTAAERSVPVRLLDDVKHVGERLFGPGYLLWKVSAVALVFIVGVLVLLPVEYRVTAKMVVESETQRVVAAPFEGFIGAAYVRAGDTVHQGQPMVQLEDRELRIEQEKWSSERDQYAHRLREAMATHDLTNVQVVGAQLRQAEAQLHLVTEKIDHARMLAPFDGVVTSGDLRQQIGAPVEVGKKLFEVAPLQRYRVILRVDERDIRHVHVGEHGQMIITGIAADPLSIRVAKVNPVAVAEEGENFFRVEASLPQSTIRLRPGMDGVAKIDAGDRQLWWVLTHSFADWLRLKLWSWLP